MVTEYIEEPIRAYKWAYILPGNDDHQTVFLGIGRIDEANRYDVNRHKAWCSAPLRLQVKHIYAHPPLLGIPGTECSCGWWGLKDFAALCHIYEEYEYIHFCGVILEVDFYGKIIQHQLGYRAEYQQILKVYVPEWSHYTKRQGEDWEVDPICNISSIADLSNELKTEVVKIKHLTPQGFIF